ncbi:uncharacterized protein LOC118556463 isoform X2 [Fundulus heteroclitus]|uniref:uncharacterized protein LOC118556463 isoform X2 n=1 Tax=Fundulus heteroclitus TaxID=8078 RepID=UPI00165C2C73|nr:uncharacterized protein LOC118556463 isoform X2 [Fundulus heteroclitus]
MRGGRQPTQDETLRTTMMEMWLKSAILALITVAGATLVAPSVIEILLDTTEQNGKTVLPGSSLNLRCCLKVNTSERCHITWHFIASGKNKTELICNQSANKCNLDSVCESSPCPLENLNETNNGLYYCNVTTEIPTLIHTCSNKTQVIVVPTDDVRDSWWMWALVGSSCLILIILLVIFAVQKRPCNTSQGEEPIYINTRMGKPSPRLMPTDNLKAVSCSKDIQTPSSVRRYEGRNQRYKD